MESLLGATIIALRSIDRSKVKCFFSQAGYFFVLTLNCDTFSFPTLRSLESIGQFQEKLQVRASDASYTRY